MPLVKNAHARDLLKNAVVLDLGDIRKQAETILQEARNAAERIIIDAHEEAARLTEGASQRGHEDGHARGLTEGHAEGVDTGQREGEAAAREQLAEQLKTIEQAWVAALEDWNARRAAQLEEGRRDLLRFSLAIAERIVGRMPQHDATRVRDQVSEAIDLLIDRTKLTVRVHPRDSSMVKSHLPGILSQLGAGSDATLKADPSVTRGGCIVSTPDGEVDGQLETQLERIVEGVLPELNDHEALERPL